MNREQEVLFFERLYGEEFENKPEHEKIQIISNTTADIMLSLRRYLPNYFGHPVSVICLDRDFQISTAENFINIGKMAAFELWCGKRGVAAIVDAARIMFYDKFYEKKVWWKSKKKKLIGDHGAIDLEVVKRVKMSYVKEFFPQIFKIHEKMGVVARIKWEDIEDMVEGSDIVLQVKTPLEMWDAGQGWEGFYFLRNNHTYGDEYQVVKELTLRIQGNIYDD